MKKQLFLIIFCLLFILSSITAQNIYFVDNNNGNDSNSGTSLATPWKTIQKACNATGPNSIIQIKAGTYKENIVVNVSGTVGNPITFKAYMNDAVFIDGSGTSGSTLLTIKDKSYLNFENLTLQNLTKNNAIGILVECSTSGTVHALHFSKLIFKSINWTNNATAQPGSNNNSQPFIAYGRGTTAANAITNLLIENCEFYNNITGYSETMSLDGNIDGFSIKNNYVHDNINIGIYVGGNYGECSIPVLDHVRNGTIESNTCSNNVAFYATSGGIYADGAQNVLIQKNKCTGNGYGIEVGCEENGSTDNIVVINNLIIKNKEAGIAIGGYTATTTGQVLNCIFRNNTLFQNDDLKNGSGEFYITKASGCVFENNILYTNTEEVVMSLENISPQTGNTFNYNCWFTPSGNASNITVNWKNTNYTSFAAYKSATSQDGNSIFSNPMFSSLTLPAPNLHILTGSSCINTGKPSTAVIIGETDYEGNSRLIGNIDIGAYEFKITTGITTAAVTTLSAVAFPNPFKTETTILFNEELTDGTLEIYNPEGKKVRELTAIHGNRVNLQRGILSTGIYFYILIQTHEFVCTGKLIVE